MQADMTQSAKDDTPHGTPTDSGGFSALMDRAGRTLMERPLWFTLIVVLALTLLPVAVWLDLRHLSNSALSQQASDLNAMISEIRSYYSRNVIGRIMANHGKSTPASNYQEIDGGIPIPATLSIELGRVIGGRGSNIRYRFVSDMVFKGRASHQLDEFESFALERLRNVGKPDHNVTEISGSILDYGDSHRINHLIIST